MQKAGIFFQRLQYWYENETEMHFHEIQHVSHYQNSCLQTQNHIKCDYMIIFLRSIVTVWMTRVYSYLTCKFSSRPKIVCAWKSFILVDVPDPWSIWLLYNIMDISNLDNVSNLQIHQSLIGLAFVINNVQRSLTYSEISKTRHSLFRL